MNRLFLFVLLLSLSSCQPNNIFNGKVVEVDDITSIQCQGDTVYAGIGISTIDFTLKYILLSRYKSDHFLSVLERDSYLVKEELCLKGKGRGEFLSLRIVNQENEPNRVIFRDYYRNEVGVIDVDSSLERGETVVISKSNLRSDGSLLEVFCGRGNLLEKYHDLANQKIVYSINDNEFFDLYNIPISANDANYMMTLADGYENDNNKIVSLNGSNQIDIIDLDKPKKSLSIREKGSQGWDINSFKNRDKSCYYLTMPRFNKDFIVVLYDNSGKSEFHITDWHGSFMHKIVVDDNIRDFNIDWNSGSIYGVSKDEYVIIYDVSNYISGE